MSSQPQIQPVITQQKFKQSSFVGVRNDEEQGHDTKQKLPQQSVEDKDNQYKDSNTKNTDNKHFSKILAPNPSNQPSYFCTTTTSLPQKQFFKIMDKVDEYDKLLEQMNQLYTSGMLAIANVKFINPYTSLSTKGYKPTPAIRKVKVNQNMIMDNEMEGNQKQCDNEQIGRSNIQTEGPNCKQDQSLKYDQQDRMFSSVLQSKDIKFVYSVIQQIHQSFNNQKHTNPPQQRQPHNLQQQQDLSHTQSLSTAFQLYSYEEQQLILQQEEITENIRQFNLNKQSLSTKQKQDDFILNRFSIQTQKPMVIQAKKKFDLLLEKLLQIAEIKLKMHKMFRL